MKPLNYWLTQLAIDRAKRERTLTVLVEELNEIMNPIRFELDRIAAQKRAEVRNG